MKEQAPKISKQQSGSDSGPSWTHKPDHSQSDFSYYQGHTQNPDNDIEKILQLYPQGVPRWHPQYISLKAAGLLPKVKSEEERQKDLQWMKEDAAKNLRENWGIFWDGESFHKVEDRTSAQPGEAIQAKPRDGGISVSRPDDKEEVEADRIADRVMREEIPQEEEEKLHKKSSPNQLMAKSADSGVVDKKTETEVKSLRGKGSPLPKQTREFMESRFGADFSGVRVHTNHEAADLSQRLNAKAFTFGKDIAFNRGEFSPETRDGKKLITHELTHTVQQGAVGRKVQRQEDGEQEENGESDAKTPRNSEKKNKYGRSPTTEDKQRLNQLDLYKSILEVQYEETLETVKERTDYLYGEYTHNQIAKLKEGAKKGDPDSLYWLPRAEGYVEQQTESYTKKLQDILDAIQGLKQETHSYEVALKHARQNERIVWHNSKLFTGWFPESASLMQHEMESSPFFWMGFQSGTRYAEFRRRGKSWPEAVALVTGGVLSDITGLTNLTEAYTGSEMLTGRPIKGPERIQKAILGVVSLAALIAAGGPRISSWGSSIAGTRVAFLETAGLTGGRIPVLVMAEGGGAIALTQTEIAALSAAGVLNMAAVSHGPQGGQQPSSGTGQKSGDNKQSTGRPEPRLKNAHWGKRRGSGGKAEDIAYDKKVSGTDDSLYVKGVEFDGFKIEGNKKILFDAKRSKGKGSWYDIEIHPGMRESQKSFTKNVKMKVILKQARRQEAVLKGSGADKIQWHFSDQRIAKNMAEFFKDKTIKITVKYTAP